MKKLDKGKTGDFWPWKDEVKVTDEEKEALQKKDDEALRETLKIFGVHESDEDLEVTAQRIIEEMRRKFIESLQGKDE